MKPVGLVLKIAEEKRALRAVQSQVDKEHFDLHGNRTRYPKRLKTYGGDVEKLTPKQRRRLLKKQRQQVPSRKEIP